MFFQRLVQKHALEANQPLWIVCSLVNWLFFFWCDLMRNWYLVLGSSNDRLQQTPWVLEILEKVEKWKSQMNKNFEWRPVLAREGKPPADPVLVAVTVMLVTVGEEAKRKHWHIKWPQRQTKRKQRGSLVFFFSTPRFLQFSKSQIDNRSLFVWRVSDVFLSFDNGATWLPAVLFFRVRTSRWSGAEERERRDAHFAALAAIWWDGAESLSGVMSFLPLRLRFSRVFLLLTFRISSASHHLFPYFHNFLFVSTHSANFIFALKDLIAASWWDRNYNMFYISLTELPVTSI